MVAEYWVFFIVFSTVLPQKQIQEGLLMGILTTFLGSIFIVMQFSGKIGQNNRLAPPLLGLEPSV